jgi:type I restriction enzyme M protein
VTQPGLQEDWTTMSNISGIVKSARNIMRQDTGTGSDELRILQLGWM